MSAQRAIDRYPGIKRAALELLYDNGSINRFRPEEDALADVEAVLIAEGVYADDLDAINAWLAGLSEDDLLTAVAGEETDMKKLLASAPPHTDGLLNDIHENAS